MKPRYFLLSLFCALFPCLSLFAQEPASEPSSQPVIDEARVFTKEDVEYLYSKELIMPTQGIKPSTLLNTYRISGGSHHRATDIMAPRNTPLVAVTDATVHRMYHGKTAGISVYLLDENGSILYYYAHLSRYAEGLKEGMSVKKGDVIGYVGTTGNAKGRLPHVHFSIFKAPNPKRWWKVAALNPYYVLTNKEYPLDDLTNPQNLAPEE
jgi:murein DD-endopeptidase MepM/ murein hydrolase activator NlpD